MVVAQRLHLPRSGGRPSRRRNVPARDGVAGLHPYRPTVLPPDGGRVLRDRASAPARDGATALTIRQSYFEPMPPAEAMDGAEQGWSEQLDKLERLLAS